MPDKYLAAERAREARAAWRHAGGAEAFIGDIIAAAMPARRLLPRGSRRCAPRHDMLPRIEAGAREFMRRRLRRGDDAPIREASARSLSSRLGRLGPRAARMRA